MQGLHLDRGGKAHRALQIQEICDAVAAHADYLDARSLLYTSRAFFRSAIRYVWGVCPIAAQDVLKLLAGFIYPSYYCGIARMKIDLPRPLPVGYFDRFNIYAPHIRELNCSFTEPINTTDALAERYSSDDIQFLLDTLGSTVLLPNLVRVTLGDPDWVPCQIGNPGLLGIFISPFVTRFAILGSTYFDDESGFTRFFEYLCTRVFPICPNLQEFSLLCGIENDTKIENPQEDTYRPHKFKDLPVLAHLSSVAFSSGILSVELIDWISKLPRLNTLTFWNLGPRNRPALKRAVLPNSSFQNLRILILDTCELDEILILWGTPLVSHLTEVRCSIIPPGQNPRMWMLFSLMANRSRQLTKINIARAKNAGSWSELYPMPGWTKSWSNLKLTELSIQVARLDGPRPMCAIASIWPSLRKLELSDRWVKEDDFLELPARLPNIEYLTVGVPPVLDKQDRLARYRLDTMPKSPTTSALMLNTQLHILRFSLYSQLVIDQLARFFSRWWPNMQLEVPSPTDEPQKVRRDAYRRINRRILDLSLGDQTGSSS